MSKFDLGDKVRAKDPTLIKYYKYYGWEEESPLGTIIKVGPYGYTVDFGPVKDVLFGKDLKFVEKR